MEMEITWEREKGGQRRAGQGGGVGSLVKTPAGNILASVLVCPQMGHTDHILSGGVLFICVNGWSV